MYNIIILNFHSCPYKIHFLSFNLSCINWVRVGISQTDLNKKIGQQVLHEYLFIYLLKKPSFFILER